MNAWQQWIQRPQNVWLRRALFQVHLWVGVGLGLYVVLVSISGSAIVYRPQLMKAFAPKPKTVVVSGVELSDSELTQRIAREYPGYDVAYMSRSTRADGPTTVLLRRGNQHISRLFNPYTGADLGDPISPREKVVQWLVDFHDNLLAGPTGRFWNGVGAILITITSFSGLVLWWPGIKNWRRSMIVKWNANLPVFNWTLHSATGFWCSALMLMWGFSGIYFAFPQAFISLFGSSRILFWLSRLHIGRFGRFRRVTWFDWLLSMLWVVLGLAPAALAVTGFLIWWNRVLRKRGPSAVPFA